MTLDEFFAEAKRIGLTAEVFAAQLAERPEFADCLPLASPAGKAEPVAWWRISYIDPEGHSDADVQIGKDKPTPQVLADNGFPWEPLYATPPAATPAAPGDVTLNKKDLNKLLNDFARACAFGDDLLARMATSKAIHEYLDAAFAALSSPAPVAAPAPSMDNFEHVIQWVRDNYQDHNIASFCDGLRAAYYALCRPAAPAPASEAVAEVVSQFGDPEAFGEREIKVLSDLQKLPYGTKLYATPTPGDSADAPVQQAGEAEAKAKKLYTKHTDNHPTIHCNRFPAWDELSATERDEWRAKARAALKGEQPAEPSGSERGEV